MRQEFSEKEIVKGIYEQTEKQIKTLNDSIAKLSSTLSDYQSKEIPVEAISKELFAQYPDITEVSLSRGSSVNAANSTTTEQIIAFITTAKPMDNELHDRIERWLKVRLNNNNVMLVCQSAQTETDTE